MTQHESLYSFTRYLDKRRRWGIRRDSKCSLEQNAQGSSVYYFSSNASFTANTSAALVVVVVVVVVSFIDSALQNKRRRKRRALGKQTYLLRVRGKNRTTRFWNVSYKTQAILMKFGRWRLWQLITLLQYQNQISSIVYLQYTTLWNLKCSSRTCYRWVVKERNSRMYFSLTVTSNFVRSEWFESGWFQRVESTTRKAVQTHNISLLDFGSQLSGLHNTHAPRITDLDMSTTSLTNNSRKDDAMQLGSHPFFHFVQISDACCVYFTLQHSAYAVISWTQIWQILRPQMRCDKL